MKTTIQPQISLLSLLCAANFDKNRIVIADSDLTAEGLQLWLEDKQEPVANMEDAVQVFVPIADLATIITDNEFNSYEATLFSEGGRPYQGRVVIAEPLKWFEEDATTYERNNVLDAVKVAVIKQEIGGKL